MVSYGARLHKFYCSTVTPHKVGIYVKMSPTDIQLASLIPERFAFYDVFSGYFDLLKVSLKVQTRSRASGSKQILVGSTN